MINSHRNILVVWSGGYDSTWLLLDLLDTYKDDENVSIYTIYIELKNNVNKSAAEQRQRELMKQIIREDDHGYGRVYCGDIGLGPKIQIVNVDFSGYQWVVFAVLLRFWLHDNTHKKFDEICFGFMMDEEFWSFKQGFIDIFRGIPIIERYAENSHSLQKVMDEPELSFPLQFVSKQTIFQLLKSHDVGKKLFDVIWTCELPIRDDKTDTYTPCGTCSACNVKWEHATLEIAREQRKKEREEAQPQSQEVEATQSFEPAESTTKSWLKRLPFIGK